MRLSEYVGSGAWVHVVEFTGWQHPEMLPGVRFAIPGTELLS